MLLPFGELSVDEKYRSGTGGGQQWMYKVLLAALAALACFPRVSALSSGYREQ